MPVYLYESTSGDDRFEFLQSLSEAPYQQHPETGEAIQRVVADSFAIGRRGLKRSTQINKSLPAATACGCANNAALAIAQSASERARHRKTKLSPLHSPPSGSGCGHRHPHGGSCGHQH
jgi:bacterioferritin-associated ferredoxin